MKQRDQADISVIVPIYNVGEYLKECLDSLLHQGEVDAEIILIDDGSIDSGAEIAKEYALKYENYQYHYEENAGQGHARNRGVHFASGKYIAFVDADDIVVEGVYENMFRIAERNKSDVVICNAARFNSKKIWPSVLHKKARMDIGTIKDISYNPSLIFDTSPCNKLISRSFYLRHGFKFPEDSLYEDLPVVTDMLIRAKNISAINNVGYLWRLREGADLSVTQRTSDIKNFYDRMKIIRMVDLFFDSNVRDPKLNEMKQFKILDQDLMIFVNICGSVRIEQSMEIMRTIKEYIRASIDERILGRLSLLKRQKYACVLKEDLDHLIQTCNFQKEYESLPVTEKNGEFYIDLPDRLFSIKDRNVTCEIFRYGFDYLIDNVSVSGNRIKTAVRIFKRRVIFEKPVEQKVSAGIYNEITEAFYPLPVISGKYDEGTGDYTFDIIIDADELQLDERFNGRNNILLNCENRFISQRSFLAVHDAKMKQALKDLTLTGGRLYRLRVAYLNTLEFHADAGTPL